MFGGPGALQAQYIGPECFTLRKDNLLQNCWDTLYFLVFMSTFCKIMDSGRPPPKGNAVLQGNVVSMCICQHTKAFLCRRHLCAALRLPSLLTLVSINQSNIALLPWGEGEGDVCSLAYMFRSCSHKAGLQKGKCPNYICRRLCWKMVFYQFFECHKWSVHTPVSGGHDYILCPNICPTDAVGTSQSPIASL